MQSVTMSAAGLHISYFQSCCYIYLLILLILSVAASIRVPSFGSSSFLIFEDVLAASASTGIDVEFKASDDDGVLFWNSDGTDFIGLGLVGGRMVFTFDLGSGQFYEIYSQITA